MKLERVAVVDILLAAYNPRKDLKPGDPEYVAIERSIQRWDIVEPLVWNERTGNLVSGHQRLKVLIARGDTAVDVSVVDLDEHEEQALSIALNKVQGRWDDTKLADLISSLDTAFGDVEMTGFTPTEVIELMRLAAPPLFTPALPENMAVNELRDTAVTGREVASVAQEQATKFQGASPQARVIKDVTCPNCGHTFGVVA